MSDQILDLFGEPVRPDRGAGRPPFEWTVEKSNRVKVLFACGYEPKEVAPILGCCLKTFRKVFSLECRERKIAELKLRSTLMLQLADQAKQGNVAAIKALGGMVEREKAKALSERMIGRAQASVAKEKAAPKLGKKAEARKAAEEADGLYATRNAPPGLSLN